MFCTQACQEDEYDSDDSIVVIPDEGTSAPNLFDNLASLKKDKPSSSASSSNPPSPKRSTTPPTASANVPNNLPSAPHPKVREGLASTISEAVKKLGNVSPATSKTTSPTVVTKKAVEIALTTQNAMESSVTIKSLVEKPLLSSKNTEKDALITKSTLESPPIANNMSETPLKTKISAQSSSRTKSTVESLLKTSTQELLPLGPEVVTPPVTSIVTAACSSSVPAIIPEVLVNTQVNNNQIVLARKISLLDLKPDDIKNITDDNTRTWMECAIFAVEKMKYVAMEINKKADFDLKTYIENEIPFNFQYFDPLDCKDLIKALSNDLLTNCLNNLGERKSAVEKTVPTGVMTKRYNYLIPHKALLMKNTLLAVAVIKHKIVTPSPTDLWKNCKYKTQPTDSVSFHSKKLSRSEKVVYDNLCWGPIF